MFKKLIEWFKPSPFTDNEDDFILKNEATWFSENIRIIFYSVNKGKTFRTIRECKEPPYTYGKTIFQYDYTLEPVCFDAETTSFSQYKYKFNSIKIIKEFEKKEYQKYLKGKELTIERRKKYNEMIKQNIS